MMIASPLSIPVPAMAPIISELPVIPLSIHVESLSVL